MEILNSDLRLSIPTASFFLSAPTSPDRHLLDALLFSDDSETCGDFEFDTSRRYCFQGGPLLPSADELFSDGTVLPLKLPPCLRGGTRSPTGSSHGSVFRTPFLWWSEFDPFVAALEKVRRVEKRGRRWESSGRRARSLSPFRARANKGFGEEEELPGLRSGLLDRAENKSLDHLDPPEGLVAKRLAQPRGLEFARRVRQVELKKSGNVESGEPTKKTVSSTLRKKPSFLRRLSFKSSRSAQSIEREKMSEAVKSKIGFLHSKTKLLCLGYGIKTNS